jgi:hypothetical protein
MGLQQGLVDPDMPDVPALLLQKRTFGGARPSASVPRSILILGLKVAGATRE